MANPTHEQAQLQLKFYDLRREARLRQARDWFSKNYFADNFDEAMKIAPMGTEAGTSYMMVVSYWDQACAYLNHGLLHEDLFFETSGEFFFVWERVKPAIKEGRKRSICESRGLIAPGNSPVRCTFPIPRRPAPRAIGSWVSMIPACKERGRRTLIHSCLGISK